VLAELRGWDGFFVWGPHQVLAADRERVADPWIVLSAVADGDQAAAYRADGHSDLTPPRAESSRRETVTLDRLSGGRPRARRRAGRRPATARLGPFGEGRGSARAGRSCSTTGSTSLARFLGAASSCRPPVQQPRIPIWGGGRAIRRARRLTRARARWGTGVFPIDVPGPDVLAEYVAGLPSNGQFRGRRHQPRRAPTARRGADAGGDLVPDRLRAAADRGRGPRGHRSGTVSGYGAASMSAPLRRVLVRRPALSGDWGRRRLAGCPTRSCWPSSTTTSARCSTGSAWQVEIAEPLAEQVDAVYMHDPVVVVPDGAPPAADAQAGAAGRARGRRRRYGAPPGPRPRRRRRRLVRTAATASGWTRRRWRSGSATGRNRNGRRCGGGAHRG